MENKKRSRKRTLRMKDLWRVVIAAQGLCVLSAPMQAYALQETRLYTGTISLINDALVVLLAVETALVVFLLVKELIALQAAADEDKPKHKKNIKTILVVGVLVISASGILTAVFSYYRA